MALQFKEGIGWKCCYDPDRNLYTARTGGAGNEDLYEIDKDIYDRVDDPGLESPTGLISKGRHLFMSVDDRCGPPYTVVFDSDYEDLCPWINPKISGHVWGDELTDAAVEVFESEKNNREQRRRKRKEREKEKREELFRQYAGRYRLTKMVIGGDDVSESFEKGWKDKSRYMLFEITVDGKFFLKAHTEAAEKDYEYYFDPLEMKYYLKEDRSDGGTQISIENGVLREETPDHLMVYELMTDTETEKG